MKSSLLITILLLTACGDYKVSGTGKNSVGEIKELTSMSVSGTDLSRLQSACNALQTLEGNLASAVNSTHSYSIYQTDCSGSLLENREVSTVLVPSGSNYGIKRASDGIDFIFPNVETASSGIFSEICSNLNDLSSPVGNSNQKTYFTTMGINADDCAQVVGEVCVKIEKATVQGLTAIVHTKDFLRVRVSHPTYSKIGFITYRKKITKSVCGTNEVLLFQASLL